MVSNARVYASMSSSSGNGYLFRTVSGKTFMNAKPKPSDKTKSTGGYCHWDVTAFFILVAAAFLTRLLPLSISQYPFNNDGLTECRLASSIVDSGHLRASADAVNGTTHSLATPAMNVLIAYLSSILGVSPFECSQVLVATVAVVTVGSVYMIARDLSGGIVGGVTASLMAVMMGTFLFTTGSVWKVSLGIALLVLVLVSFIRRNEMRFRAACFVLLMVMPLVHHLVAAIALLAIAFPLVWSWFLAVTKHSFQKRNVVDLLMIAVPTAWTVAYYSTVSFDRLQAFSSFGNVMLLLGGFLVLCVAAIAVLSMKSHSKRTFAPLLGIGITVLLVLDYYGYLYSYTPTAPEYYLYLVVAFGFMLSIAWYGSEIILERRPRYNAVHLGLLLAPLAIMGYGFLGGFSSSSHQIIYRSFDFADVFVFTGCGAAVYWLFFNRRKTYPIVVGIIIVALAVSFPFAYATQTLLGVRHDTQAYEVDGTKWIAGAQSNPHMVSDERFSYIGLAMADIPKDNGLPMMFAANYTLPPFWIGAMEDYWLSTGVNDYPKGLVVVSVADYMRVMQSSNVLYVGGPLENRLIIYETSYVGHVQTVAPFAESG